MNSYWQSEPGQKKIKAKAERERKRKEAKIKAGKPWCHGCDKSGGQICIYRLNHCFIEDGEWHHANPTKIPFSYHTLINGQYHCKNCPLRK